MFNINLLIVLNEEGIRQDQSLASTAKSLGHLGFAGQFAKTHNSLFPTQEKVLVWVTKMSF